MDAQEINASRTMSREEKMAAAQDAGLYFVSIKVYDGAGKPWGGVAAIKPENFEREMRAFEQEVVTFCEDDFMEEKRRELGFIQPERGDD